MKTLRFRLARILSVLALVFTASAAFSFYDPSVQRWINRDPIEEKGGLNLYGYIDNAPIDSIDPLGLLNADRFEEIEYFRLSQVPWWQKLEAELQAMVPMRNPRLDNDYFYDGLDARDLGKLLEGGGVVHLPEPVMMGMPSPRCGSYQLVFKNNMKYAGAGGLKRAMQSARVRAEEAKSQLRELEWQPAKNRREQFIDEAQRIRALGGIQNRNLLNKINSPGEKWIHD